MFNKKIAAVVICTNLIGFAPSYGCFGYACWTIQALGCCFSREGHEEVSQQYAQVEMLLNFISLDGRICTEPNGVVDGGISLNRWLSRSGIDPSSCKDREYIEKHLHYPIRSLATNGKLIINLIDPRYTVSVTFCNLNGDVVGQCYTDNTSPFKYLRIPGFSLEGYKLIPCTGDNSEALDAEATIDSQVTPDNPHLFVNLVADPDYIAVEIVVNSASRAIKRYLGQITLCDIVSEFDDSNRSVYIKNQAGELIPWRGGDGHPDCKYKTLQQVQELYGGTVYLQIMQNQTIHIT